VPYKIYRTENLIVLQDTLIQKLNPYPLRLGSPFYCELDSSVINEIAYDLDPSETLTNYCALDSSVINDITPPPELGTWSPSAIATTLWLDADDQPTITNNSIGEVSQWDDKSGNGYHVSQGSTANQPVTGQNPSPLYNFRNRIYFNTTSKRLLNTAWNFTLTSQHTFIVYTYETSGRLLSQSNSGTDLATNMYVPSVSTSATSISSYLSGTFRSAVSMVTTNAKPNLFESHHNGTVLSNRINAGTPVNFTGTLNATISRIGLNCTLSASGGVEVGGIINLMELVIINNTSLSASDIEKMRGYLAWKWNMVSDLPSGHPYKTTPPDL
jgi:hypothetical protein